MTAHPNSSFRGGAFALTALAALASASYFPARGQDLAINEPQVTPQTDCSRFHPGELLGDTKCEILKGRAIDAEGRKLDAELVRQQQIGVCLRKIKVFFDSGKVTRDTIIKYGKDRACELAKTLG